MSRRTLPSALLAGACCLLAAATSTARAEAPVQVTVHVIHVSKKKGKVDPRVRGLARQLEGFGFKSFALRKVQRLRLPLGAPGSVELPAGRKLEVTPRERDARGKLKVRVRIEGLVDTTYSINDGATILFGGLRDGDGTLVLAVTQT